MKLIALSRGLFARVDDEDFEELSKFKWHTEPSRNTFYAKRQAPYTCPNGRYGKRVYSGPATIAMHRIILGIQDSKLQVDHIDGDGLNNQRSNLRICDAKKNQYNQKKHKNCSSRFKGVYWFKAAKKWRAMFGPPESRRSLGCFSSEEDAALAYNVAASFAFKEFANLNKIDV